MYKITLTITLFFSQLSLAIPIEVWNKMKRTPYGLSEVKDQIYNNYVDINQTKEGIPPIALLSQKLDGRKKAEYFKRNLSIIAFLLEHEETNHSAKIHKFFLRSLLGCQASKELLNSCQDELEVILDKIISHKQNAEQIELSTPIEYEKAFIVGRKLRFVHKIPKRPYLNILTTEIIKKSSINYDEIISSPDHQWLHTRLQELLHAPYKHVPYFLKDERLKRKGKNPATEHRAASQKRKRDSSSEESLPLSKRKKLDTQTSPQFDDKSLQLQQALLADFLQTKKTVLDNTACPCIER